MICKNPYCKSPNFIPVIELDDNRMIGVKCMSCGARYSINDIEISSKLKREAWNSVKWATK